MKKLIALIFLFQFFSCSTSTDKNDTETKSSEPVDNVFPFKNLTSTDKLDYWDKPYRLLDSAEKMQLLAPVLFDKNSSKGSLDYFIHWQYAKFISKQNNIRDLTPIIIGHYGDDYDALWYVVLDKGRPTSVLQIGGSGMWGGPEQIQDSLLRLGPDRRSVIKNNEIWTYVVTETVHPDSVPKMTFKDSITYISKVLSSGLIETKRQDSVRLFKMKLY